MAEKTEISWTHHTWSPWEGCTKVSPGCDHCYAEGMNRWLRKGANWGPGAPRREYSDEHWAKPLKWDAAAKAAGVRRRVFPSVCDPFDNEAPIAWRANLFFLIDQTPNLDWLLLTKRIGNAQRMLAETSDYLASVHRPLTLPLPNVWLGATIVNQEEADRDIPKLLAVPARVRFLSMEPLLGPVDLSPFLGPVCCGNPVTDYGGEYMGQREAVQSCCGNPDPSPLDWVIVGGESGGGARLAHPEWYRSLRDQCAAARVPFHFKQHGEWVWVRDIKADDCKRGLWVRRNGETHDGTDQAQFSKDGGDALIWHVGKKAAGRLLDGVEHNGFPEQSR